MTRHRKDRGMRTQLVVANYLRGMGWLAATSAASGRPGADILNVPFDCEVKARKDFNPKAWLDQVRKRNAGQQFKPMSFVVMRFNGQGEDAGQYGALLDFETLTGLLLKCGYLTEGISRCQCGSWITDASQCTICKRLDDK